MPTGYTAPVADGSITKLKDFALLCARAFGVAISMRDEPLSKALPLEFAPDTEFYDEQIKELQQIEALPEKELHRKYEEYVKEHKETIERLEKERINKVLVNYGPNTWEPIKH